MNKLILTLVVIFTTLASGLHAQQRLFPGDAYINHQPEMPYVITQPQSVVAITGQSADLRISAGGFPQSYQWQKDGVNIPNANDSIIAFGSLVAQDAGNYRCIVSNACGSDTSHIAQLEVVSVSPPVVTNAIGCLGDIFNLNASGASGFAVYKWYSTLSDSLAIHTGQTYTTAVLTQSDTFWVAIDSLGFLSDEVPLVVTVYLLPVVSFSNQPAVCENSPAIALSSGTPVGGVYSGPAVISNYFYPIIAGAANHSILYSYTDINGCSGSDTAQITVTALPTPGFTTNSPVCFGDTLTITYTGNATSSASYNWNFDGGTVVSGSGQGPYKLIWPHSGMRQISLMVSENGCTSQTNSTWIMILNNEAILSVFGSTNFCQGDSNLLSANTGPGLYYQWFRNDTIIPLISQSHYYAKQSGDYKVKVSSAYACSAISNSITLQAYPVPQPNFSIPATICAYDTTTITYIGNAGVSANYSWSLDSGLLVSGGNQGPLEVIWNTAGPKLINLQVNENGCQSAVQTAQIMVNTAVANIFVPGSTTICQGDSVNLSAISVSGSTYQWYRNNTLINGATQSQITASIAGIYKVIATSPLNCVSTDSIEISLFSSPTVSFASPPAVCENSPAIALSSGTPVGGVYSGPAVISNYFYPIIAGAANHSISYSYTDINGCSGSDTAQITVTALPTPGFTTNSPVCFGDTLTITYTGNATSSASYNWNFDGGTVVSGSGQGPYKLIWPHSGMRQISLTVSENGCTSQTNSTWIMILNNEAILSVFGSTNFCQGDSLLLLANTGTGLSYQWFRNDTLIPLISQSHYYAKQSGDYEVKVSSAYACSAISNSITLQAYPVPQPNFSIPATICAYDTTTITYTGNAGVSANYSWGLDSGLLVSGGNQGPLEVIWNTAGPKLITLQVNENGCQSVIQTAQIMVNTAVANIFVPGSTSICQGDSVALFANTGTAQSYQWQRDGNELVSATHPWYHAKQTGNYSVRVTNAFNSCKAVSAPVAITVNPTAFNLGFTASSTNLTSSPFLVAFTNQTPDKTNYYFTWNFGDGNTSSFNEPFHQYLFNGVYDVTLIAQHINTGCSDTLQKAAYITCNGGSTNPCSITASINQGGATILCPGDSLLITANISGANGPVGYQWFVDGILQASINASAFYTKQPGLYRLVVSDSVCSFTSPAFLIAHYPVVKPQILARSQITPCTNDSMLLDVTTWYSSYQWSTGAHTSGVYVHQSGNYFVTTTDANGCTQVSDPFVVNASLLQPPQICVAGVDTNNRISIAWERPITDLIDSFYVYRESTIANVYQRIVGLAYHDTTLFCDFTANPSQTSYRYRLTAVDTCGMETPMSDVHKTMHLKLYKGLPGTWNLYWDAYDGFNYGSYGILRGTDSLNLTLLTLIQSNLNSFTDVAPPGDTVYYRIQVANPMDCNPAQGLNYNTSYSNIVSNIAHINSVNTHSNNTLAVNVYPNPNTGSFTLSIDNAVSGTIVISLVNALGQKVYSEVIHNRGNIVKQIVLQNIPEGIYLLRVECIETSIVRKVVIKR